MDLALKIKDLVRPVNRTCLVHSEHGQVLAGNESPANAGAFGTLDLHRFLTGPPTRGPLRPSKSIILGPRSLILDPWTPKS